MRIPRVSVCQLVPDRKKTGRNQSPRTASPVSMRWLLIGCAGDGPDYQPPIRDECGAITFYFFVLSLEYRQAPCSSI
jgi:hypothetical protein